MRTIAWCVLIVGCGGGGSSGDSSSATSPPDYPDCEVGQARLVGTIEGVDVDVTGSIVDYGFVNAGLGSSEGLILFETAEGVRFEAAFFSQYVVANGDPAPARVNVLTGLDVGDLANCDSARPSTIVPGDPHQLDLRELAAAADPCGAAVGDLAGCAWFE